MHCGQSTGGTFDDPQWPQQQQQSEQRGGWSNQMTMLFLPEHRWSLLGCCYLCVFINFLFYGMSYALPQLLPVLNPDMNPATELFVASSGSIPGSALASICLLALRTHRDQMLLVVAFIAALELPMSLIQGQGGLPSSTNLELFCVFCLKITCFSAFSLIYVYLGKVFPAELRCTGVAFCIGAGRVGSILTPLVFEAFMERGHNTGPYFSLCCLSCILAVVVIRTMLEDIDEVESDVVAAVGTSGAAAAFVARDRERRLSEIAIPAAEELEKEATSRQASSSNDLTVAAAAEVEKRKKRRELSSGTRSGAMP